MRRQMAFPGCLQKFPNQRVIFTSRASNLLRLTAGLPAEIPIFAAPNF